MIKHLSDTRKTLGYTAESLTCEYLKRRGYRILQRNYRCRFGEVDIIALDGEVLAVIEVKSLSSAFLTTPLEKIDRRKQERLFRIAQYYVQQKRETSKNIRFDVVSVEMSPGDTSDHVIHLIKDAFRMY